MHICKGINQEKGGCLFESEGVWQESEEGSLEGLEEGKGWGE